jgi:hypothetical protein
MSTDTNVPSPAADTPQPATRLAPEAVIEQLRALRAQIPEVTPLTPKQRNASRNKATTAEPIVQASITVIGVSENVAHALGSPIDNARAMQVEAIRWKAVEEELRGFLSGIAGANFIRQQKLALLGAQAYSISAQLARTPENLVLVPHVQEIKRLKRLARRKKKPAEAPEAPSPAPPVSAAVTESSSETKK